MEAHYKPIIKEDVRISGIAGETIPSGMSGKIIQRTCIYSLDKNFTKYFNSTLNFFLDENVGNGLNQMLVIIKPDLRAFIYKKFPTSMNIVASRDLKGLTPVYIEDLADLTSISFSDSIHDLNPEKGDQIVWLFRINWRFGLYFDFTGTQEKHEIQSEMGYWYKRLMYINHYQFIENSQNFNELVKDGWFPFIRLHGQFNKLIAHYDEEEKFDVHVNQILDHFDKERILKFTESWWKNPILNSKRALLQAGIDAYLAKNSSGYISCIKNLTTELEGIIRISCFRETGNKHLSTKQLKEYIVNSGKNVFTSFSSLGFTSEFMLYLDNCIFKDFDLENDAIPTSRHAVAHGVATEEYYSQKKALQLILTIDQVRFFLGNKPL